MGIYDSYNDTPFRIKTEGETITLQFQQSVPAAGQGTISWNIPAPGPGTDSAPEGPGVYAGIVVVVSHSPLNQHNFPRNGIIYTADPTLDPRLHTGDKIGNAWVVGAFYEAAKVGAGQPLTSTFVVNDLQANTRYYVGAFAVDAEFRYHTAGVRAYSDKFGEKRGQDAPSRQYVKLGSPNERHSRPTLPSHGTGLIPGMLYQFDVALYHHWPKRHEHEQFSICVKGENSLLYCDLIREINKQFDLLLNPPQSPVAPGTGTIFWDEAAQTLFQVTFVPSSCTVELTPLTNVIISPTDPTHEPAGSYWFDTTTNQLFVRGGSPLQWLPVNVIKFGNVNPLALDCDDYWIQPIGTSPFHAINAFIWNGATWCVVPNIVSTTDPSCPPANLCGAFWYDQANQKLFEWNVQTLSWVQVSAIVWPTAPNMLPDGTFWFDMQSATTGTLNVRRNGAWVQLGVPGTSPQTQVIVSTTNPFSPVNFAAPNTYWYNPSTEILQFYDGHTVTTLPVLVWPTDPTIVESCNLWWNASLSPSGLMVWNVNKNEWVPVAQFFDQETDPSLPPVIAPGTIWFNPATDIPQVWDGAAWQPVEFVINSYDPTQPHIGDAWFNPANNQWYVFNGTTWVLIHVTYSPTDPTMPALGTFWVNTGVSPNAVSQWNGFVWVPALFTTVNPLPKGGQMWFNTTNNTLYRWDSLSSKWICWRGLLRAILDERGFIVIETEQRGSGMFVLVLVPGGSFQQTTGHADFASESIPSVGLFDLEDALNDPEIDHRFQFPKTRVTPEAFLFNNLACGARVGRVVIGADAVADVPTYMELGVGTDGTETRRRALADVLRRQLGYPAVQVELDKNQLNDCISFAFTQLRQKSSLAYKRGFFFLDIAPRQQKYILTNKHLGYNKIVNVMQVNRFTSAFLSTANGSGVYGQIVLQHLYNMGTYDLTSFYLVSNYVEQMELLFSTRLTFAFDEESRVLWLFNTFTIHERVLMDCTVEKTEQEIMTNRLAVNWIREWALSEAMLMLSQIRGKYASLPGAGGGVTLNASELRDRGEKLQEKLLQELDDKVAQDVESYGAYADFTIG